MRRQHHDAGLGVYQCRYCWRFHIGHQKSRAADRITQLLEQRP